MTEKVPQHTHCQICGKAIPITETLCSEECKTKYEKMIKGRKRYIYLFYATIVLIIVLFGLQYLGG